jgi:hypothetical protein
VEATRSAVVTFKRLLYVLAEHHELFLPEVTPVWEALERATAEQAGAVAEAAGLLIGSGRAELARDLLTRFCEGEALRALDLGETMADSMERRSRVLFGIRDEPGWRGPERLW